MNTNRQFLRKYDTSGMTSYVVIRRRSLYDRERERGVNIGVGLALHSGIVWAFIVVSNRVCIRIQYTPNSLHMLFINVSSYISSTAL